MSSEKKVNTEDGTSSMRFSFSNKSRQSTNYRIINKWPMNCCDESTSLVKVILQNVFIV